MTKTRKFLIQLLIFSSIVSVILSLSFAQEDKNRKAVLNQRLDPVLAKISLSMALLNAHISFMAEIHCLLASTIENRQSLAICEIFKKAATYTSQTVKSTLKTKKPMSKGFLFYAWRGNDWASGDEDQHFGIWTSEKGDEPIGLFESMEDCKTAEDIFRDLDISTRPCRSWKSDWFYQLEIKAREQAVGQEVQVNTKEEYLELFGNTEGWQGPGYYAK